MYLLNTPKATLPSRVMRTRSVSHRRRTAAQKAALAAGILNGEVAIKLSMLQVARLAGVNMTYVRKACQLTPAKRQAIADGFVFPEPEPSEAELVDIIRRAGVDRVLTVACAVENAA